MNPYGVETTTELIDKECSELAQRLKELEKLDGNVAWDMIHKLGHLIEMTNSYVSVCSLIKEES